MSERVYTIQACDVVPGMLWHGTPIEHVRTTVYGNVGIRVRSGSVLHYVDDDTVTVGLPGMSPRKLCTCLVPSETATGYVEDVAIGDHADDCPVRTMRLRLWPVGAKWNWASRGWLVPVGEHDQAYVLPRDVCNNFADMMDHAAASLRTAFCEPDPT